MTRMSREQEQYQHRHRHLAGTLNQSTRYATTTLILRPRCGLLL
jgi:hypothetical protein